MEPNVSDIRLMTTNVSKNITHDMIKDSTTRSEVIHFKESQASFGRIPKKGHLQIIFINSGRGSFRFAKGISLTWYAKKCIRPSGVECNVNIVNNGKDLIIFYLQIGIKLLHEINIKNVINFNNIGLAKLI